MARNRQRAKERQAQRRAARLADGRSRPEEVSPSVAADEPAAPDRSKSAAELAASAPPETIGRSDMALEHSPPPPDLETFGDEAPLEVEDGDGRDGGGLGRTRAGGDEAEPSGAPEAEPSGRPERGRLITFLQAVVAELRRVQWPNRSQLTTLTGVVLGFVLLAGGYLGLLDAIFSRLVKAIL